MTRKARVLHDVHGLLLLDKPLGLSSNRALQQVRWLFGARRAGHTGSLDPLATGLLPLCFGEATKIAGYLLGSSKAYLAECCLGQTTSTDDGEGEVTDEQAVPQLEVGRTEALLKEFVGRIQQVPPIYSALKQGGEPLYRKARRGEQVKVAAREVEIHRLDLVAIEGHQLRLHIECGSGTYIRSLARDIGQRLGCGAHLSSLRRIWVEPFDQPCMYTIEELEAYAEQGQQALAACLLPIRDGLAHWPRWNFDRVPSEAIRTGRKVRAPATAHPGRCLLEDRHGEPLALGEVSVTGEIRVVRGFHFSDAKQDENA